MAKYAAKGITLEYLNGSTWTEIAQIRSFNLPVGGEVDKVDVTTLDQADNFREFVSTWITLGSAGVTVVWDYSHASHIWVRENAGSDQSFRATFTDTGAATETFTASIGAPEHDVDVDGAHIATFNLNLLTAPTYAA